MEVERAVRTLTLRMETAAAALRFETALRALERRYRADQPRMPAGTSAGGQWTDADGSSDHRQDAALAAPLIGQRVGIVETELKRMRTYIDMFGRQYSREVRAGEPCPRTLVVPPYWAIF
jgi:hypothetical protein